MKLTPEQNTNIQEAFQKMNSKSDFLDLLNFVKKIEYGEKTIPFSAKQLNYYINQDVKIDFLTDKEKKIKFNKVLGKKSCYTSFSIKKKSGAERTIHAPIKGLKEFQKALNVILQCVHQPHIAATGFVIGKSIVDNAKMHVGQYYVYNIDLKDFFPSIDKSRVWGRLLVRPFNLANTLERKKIANMIAGLSCTSIKVDRLINNEWTKTTLLVLPQGAPTSPTLTNAICEKMDKRLSGVANRFGLNYTRYADDITFSSKHNNYVIDKNINEKIFFSGSSFDNEVRRIITDQNFHVKESKVRLQKKPFRQDVTGLVVNDKVNVNRRYIKQLRQWLHYWEIFGYDKAYIYFLEKYIIEKGHIKKGNPNMSMVLDGKLLYLKMVKGETDETYLKLKERFKNLLENSSVEIESFSKNIIDQILENGLEEAMKSYKI